MTRQEKRGLKDIAYARRERENREWLEPRDRKQPKKKPPRVRIDPDASDWDDIPPPSVHVKQPLPREYPVTGEGLIVSLDGRTAMIREASRTFAARAPADAAIGDRVTLSRDRATGILARRTSLSRPDPGNPHVRRVIAANIDVVVIVAAILDPPMRPGLVDRYLIASQHGSAEALLCINKVDLGEMAGELTAPYIELGVRVIACSARSGSGIDLLAEALRARTAVFVGHSGVGKSSLLNALCPGLDLATAGISTATHKGRHTTTRSRWIDLPRGGAVIDTPGIREFGLWAVDAAEVRSAFREFDRFAADCRYADCTHSVEQECGVRAAAETGLIFPARYQSYLRMIETI